MLTILFGGRSEERLVSVASAQNLARHFPEARLVFWSPTGDLHVVEQAELAAHRDAFTTPFTARANSFAGSIEAGVEYLKGQTLILALHGTEGEDGSLQRILEANRIAFTGTGARASALAFDKARTKEIARHHHLPVAAELMLEDLQLPAQEEALRAFAKAHPRLVLKPRAQGSSVGLHIVKTPAELTAAIASIQKTSLPYLAEPFLEGREITVGVYDTLDGKLAALPCSEVVVSDGRSFDYQGKYLGQGVVELTPAPLNGEEGLACQALAMQLHRAVGAYGYSRTDMILTERGPVLLEINTLPGLSKASFIPQQLSAAQISMRDFFALQVKLAEARNRS